MEITAILNRRQCATESVPSRGVAWQLLCVVTEYFATWADEPRFYHAHCNPYGRFINPREFCSERLLRQTLRPLSRQREFNERTKPYRIMKATFSSELRELWAIRRRCQEIKLEQRQDRLPRSTESYTGTQRLAKIVLLKTRTLNPTEESARFSIADAAVRITLSGLYFLLHFLRRRSRQAATKPSSIGFGSHSSSFAPNDGSLKSGPYRNKRSLYPRVWVENRVPSRHGKHKTVEPKSNRDAGFDASQGLIIVFRSFKIR